MLILDGKMTELRKFLTSTPEFAEKIENIQILLMEGNVDDHTADAFMEAVIADGITQFKRHYPNYAVPEDAVKALAYQFMYAFI